MLRKDVKYMLDNHWEPKVPTKKEIEYQSKMFKEKTFGSVRLSKGLVVGNDIKKSRIF